VDTSGTAGRPKGVKLGEGVDAPIADEPPPVSVPGGGERNPDRRGHRGGQVAHRVCGDPAEQRPGLLAGPSPSALTWGAARRRRLDAGYPPGASIR
jgi:hypothetical protein